MASSQKQKILRPKTRNNVICRSNWVRKTKTSDLKISVNSYMDRTKISNQEFSAVRQMMKAVNYRVLEIKNQIRKNGLHSILFDNTNNKTDKKQILGVILDARNHFARQKNSNRRYITFSSGSNESKNETYTQSESLEGSYRHFSGFRFKKLNFCFAALLVFALCFFVSCGGGSKTGDDSVSNFGKLGQECYPNKSCDEGLLCDEENNICIEDPDYRGDENKNDTDIENNDKDDVIGDNDKDEQPIEKEDKDDKEDSDDAIDDNDDKDNSDVNDNDPIENNDNDNNPSENDDSDYTSDLNGLFGSDIILLQNELEQLTQAQIDDTKRWGHDKAKSMCPYNYIQQPERYDEKGNLCIVDKCEGNIEDPMWLENAAPKILQDHYGVPPPETQRIVSMTVDYSNTGSQSNIKIRVPRLMLDVNFVSQSCLSQVKEDTSVIEMFPNLQGGVSTRCEINGENETLPTVVKNTKQTRSLPSKYVSLCKSMPNYQLDEHDNACYTTIEEFVWLESVTHKLLPIQSDGFLPNHPFGVKSIKRDLDTDTFYMTMQIGEKSETSEPMYVYITLKNAI